MKREIDLTLIPSKYDPDIIEFRGYIGGIPTLYATTFIANLDDGKIAHQIKEHGKAECVLILLEDDYNDD